MPRPMCETCKAYYPLSKECRRHAPRAVPVPQQDAAGRVNGMASIGIYPSTDGAKGCCEHVPDDTPQFQ